MKTIFYNEVFQMAEYGAKVIHPRAVEIAMRSSIPLIIKNTMTNSPGTLITNYDRNRKYKHDKNDKIITAIAHINGRAQVKIIFDGSSKEFEDDNFLFNLISTEGVSIDMINIYPEEKTFIIDETLCEKVQQILDKYKYHYVIKKNCSKVTIIGNKMRGVPGVMAKFIKALSKLDIQLLQTSDSHTTISCLIESEQTNTVVNALHQEFELGK